MTIGRVGRTLALLLAGACAATVLAQDGPAASAARTPAGAAAGSPGAPEYRLGSGDVVRIQVYQNPDLTLESRISESGVISYPLLGNVRIGGQTVTAAERRIADGLREGNFVRQPQVTLVVLQVRGNQVSVLGQVNRPGRYPIEVADLRLTDMLATAGGIGAHGADTVVLTGTRDGRPYRLETDLPSLFAAGGGERNVLVQHGDTLWVDRQPVVYIYGEVQRPGAMRLERGMTVMQALATGGGLTQRGTQRGIRIHRVAEDGRIQVVEPGLDDKVRDGDVVFVRESLF